MEHLRGLEPKFRVEKTNGKPCGDCIVLEFNKPYNWTALNTWAETMESKGFLKLALEVRNKVSNAQNELWAEQHPRA